MIHRKIKNFLLNTPDKYWVVVFGRHVHKSFWGVVFIPAGWFIGWQTVIGVTMTGAGVALVGLSVLGHRHTNNRPLFKLWDKHNR